MINFATELERARSAGVSNPDNLPFLLEPKNPNGKAVLLVHGFCASPFEMRHLGELLCSRGYLSLGVRLEGHGTSPEDLQARRWQEWRDSVERGYAILNATDRPIYLIGQSTGAFLCMAVAHRHPVVRMALLSPFLALRHPLAQYVGVVKYLIPFQKRQLPYPQNLHYYERRPLSGIEQIGLLRDQIRKILPEIRVPTLILAAEGDETVASGTGRQLFDLLGSVNKQFQLFGPSVPHVLSTEENPELAATGSFIENFFAAGDCSASP